MLCWSECHHPARYCIILMSQRWPVPIALCCLPFHSRLGAISSSLPMPNSNFHTSNYFQYSPPKYIFSLLEPACFAYPVKLHITSARHRYDKPRGFKELQATDALSSPLTKDYLLHCWVASCRFISSSLMPFSTRTFLAFLPFWVVVTYCWLWDFCIYVNLTKHNPHKAHLKKFFLCALPPCGHVCFLSQPWNSLNSLCGGFRLHSKSKVGRTWRRKENIDEANRGLLNARLHKRLSWDA